MRLRQGGRELAAKDVEVRRTVMYNGMETIRFRVTPGSSISAHAPAFLEDETGAIRVVVLEYHPDTGLVIVWARPTAAK